MKKTALLLLPAIILFACCKDDTPTPEPEPTCYISAITEGSDTLCQFFYDDDMRLVKYIHNFDGTSYMRFFEYNDKGLAVRINSYDLDSTKLTRYYILEYDEQDLLKKKLVYLSSQNYEYAGHEEYYYNANNILIKTESYNEGWPYPDFDTYEYDEKENCVKVFIWYHVFTTGEIKLRQYYKYYYDTLNGSFKHLPFILDGSLRFGIYLFPLITKNYNLIKFENYVRIDDESPYNYLEINYDYNEYNFPVRLDYTEFHPNTDPANNIFKYHYIIK